MKRLFCLTLALAIAMALTTPAFADVMWEPDNNSFYDQHRDQCEYENRSYYANGREGFVTLLDAPGGSMVRAQFENGEKLRIYFIYNGSCGLAAYWMDGRETSGWVPMSELELVYDYICFEEEYADRIKPYNGEFADYDGDAKRIPIYAYPGAPEPWETIKADTMDVMDNLTGRGGNSYISKIFVDEDGRTWGYVGYMYGIRNFWFCLDEPDGTDFPVRDVSVPNLTPAQTPVLPTQSYVPYILVAAVVAGTGGLLAFFYGKKRKKPTE